MNLGSVTHNRLMPLLMCLCTSLVAMTYVSATAPSAFAGTGTSSGSGDPIEIQTFKTHSRVLFSVDESIETLLKSSPKGFEVFFKGIGLNDLGAPLGEEDAWAQRFTAAADPRLQSMKFTEVSGGVKVQGVWKYPVGKQALVNPQMETFEYRQSTPSHYVLDFWLKQGTVTQNQFDAKKRQAELAAARKREEEDKRQRAERRLASEKRIAEIEDTTRFCKEPTTEKNDVFLQFLPVHPVVEFKKWFPLHTPDAAPEAHGVGYDYKKPDKDLASTQEGKESGADYLRLALDLYEQNKDALVLRTLDFFDQQHPHSEYKLETRFLRANAMIKLGLKVQGEEILKSIMSEAKDPQNAQNYKEALASGMYLAYEQIEAKNTLGASEALMWLVAHFPAHQDVWVFHFAVAEMLFDLQQTDRALKEYEWVVEKGPDQSSKAQGALRSADLYSSRFQYDQALAGYFQAIHYFEADAKKYPPIHINRAEALYGLGQYDRAKDSFIAFLNDYPGHPAGWRALYRLGEIAARQTGADGKISETAQAESRKWYVDTINQYPFSPGATLARIRLIPCGDHGGFGYDAAETFFDQEVPKFTGNGEVIMVPFKGMKALAHIRTQISYGKDAVAVNSAITELQKSGSSEVHDIIRASLNGIFRKSILALLNAGKKYEALNFYKEKGAILPKSASTPEETDYLLKLSEAASDLGLGSLAKEIADVYTKMNANRAVAGISNPDIAMQLQASEQHFSQGKAMWISNGMKSEKAVREQLSKVGEASHFSYQREIILGLMDQKSGSAASALAHAVKAQLLNPESTSTKNADRRIQAWIADLQNQSGNKQAALEGYQDLEKHIRLQIDLEKTATKSEKAKKVSAPIDMEAAGLGVSPMPALDRVMITEGEILEAQGHWGEAAKTYARAMDDGVGGDQVVYQYARSLRKTGVVADHVKARELLTKLSTPAPLASPATDGNADAVASADVQVKDSFWQQLAKEALADEKTK